MNKIFFILRVFVKIIYQLITTFGKPFKKALVRAKLATLDCNCASSAVVNISSWNVIKLEPNVSIGHGAIIIISDEKSVSGVSSSLSVGANTSINEYSNIRAAGGTISIGKNCLIAQFVTIVASNHKINLDNEIMESDWDPVKCGISIGDGTWIGAGSIILPGVKIGNGCVIGAGSVVTSNVSDHQVVAGNPAKYIRMRHL